MPKPHFLFALAALVPLLAPSTTRAQGESWSIDPGHSAATFQVRHMVVANVKGEFAGPSGSATFDPKDLSTLRIEATIDARTINTRNTDRDKDDFGLVYNRVLEGGGAVVGDAVSIELDIELTRNGKAGSEDGEGGV